MFAYIVRRVLISIPLLIGVSLITFLSLRAVAGSYVPGLDINPSLRPEDIARIREQLGLDRPVHVQYVDWISGVVRGDFGRSMIDGQPVMDKIMTRLPNTLLLGLSAWLIGVAVAIPLGIASAVHRGRPIDHFSTGVAVAGVSIPNFWLGLLLILFFALQLRSWGLPALPAFGATSTDGGIADRLIHLILPAITLSFGFLAVWSRFTRSSMLEVLAQDYVRSARAKGLREQSVLLIHAFRNAMLPLITLVGLELPGLVSGAAIVEIVFSWPGLGQLALQAANQYDLTMVLALTTFTAIMVVVGSLVADVLYAVADPRIRVR